MSEELEQVTLTFPRALPQPRATVALHFNYTLSDALDGFFRTTYKGEGCCAAPAVLIPRPLLANVSSVVRNINAMPVLERHVAADLDASFSPCDSRMGRPAETLSLVEAIKLCSLRLASDPIQCVMMLSGSSLCNAVSYHH